MDDLMVGQIVRSTAGRDKGSWMVVTELIDENYVAVCNGRNRKVSNPKKKKIKHLAKTNKIDKTVDERLKNGIKVGNAEIRRILEPFERLESPSEDNTH